MPLSFRSRRSAYFYFCFLFLLIGLWALSYIFPVLISFTKEEELFYGKVSYAAIPSIFGGSNIPFLDKTFFQINGDTGATFVLYAPEEFHEDMADWFNFAATNVADIPLEIVAVRVSDTRFIVRSLANSEGETNYLWILDYQITNALFGIILIGLFIIFSIIFFVLGLRYKKKIPQ